MGEAVTGPGMCSAHVERTSLCASLLYHQRMRGKELGPSAALSLSVLCRLMLGSSASDAPFALVVGQVSHLHVCSLLSMSAVRQGLALQHG